MNKDILPRQVYEWVKTGVWNLKMFEQWVGNDRNKSFTEGMAHREGRPLDARIGYTMVKQRV